MSSYPLDWNDSVPSSSTGTVRPPPAKVPDDWDDENDEDEPTNAKNQEIWDDANNKAPAPMPVLVHSSSSSVASIPTAALQPKMKILKRPPKRDGDKDAGTTMFNRPAETLLDREAKYMAARERIFGIKVEDEERTVKEDK